MKPQTVFFYFVHSVAIAIIRTMVAIVMTELLLVTKAKLKSVIFSWVAATLMLYTL